MFYQVIEILERENYPFPLTITGVEVQLQLTTGPWGPPGRLSLVQTEVF